MVARDFIGKATLLAGIVAIATATSAQDPQPIQYGFLWHMHQPNYYPYESVIEIDSAGYYSFSVVDVHNQRFGPYTTWPKDAVAAGTSLPHLGAQVSFTGSLFENLNVLESAGTNGGMWNNWESGYRDGIGLQTTLGNSRLDMVAFGYHHPMAPLLGDRDIRMQIALHKRIYARTFPGQPYSTGMFPAENAFATRNIPALVAEEIEWVFVDNIHFDRACVGYPHTNASNLFPANRADQINPDPAQNGGAWVQLQNLWAPSRVSAPFGYQPHNVQYVNPETGTITKMVAVPTARYEGNEDGRGGYGAFLYGTVMDAYRQYNTDAEHPMFVVLHHDGDNYGGGSEGYYHGNFQNMVAWDAGDPNYQCSTVDDYLERFPVDPDDVIHVEAGSWAGADNGDPEFKKWLGDPDSTGWSPDRNSWAVMTAARNRVYMADDVAPVTNIDGVLNGNGSPTEKAWHFILAGQASDHWYWDGTEVWDSNVTRACNQAVQWADQAIDGQTDTTPPAVFVPQREPYNPGGLEWDSTPMSSDFEVWTYAYDVSGVADITLNWRIDNDGTNPLSSIQNETFAGGEEVGAWQPTPMTAKANPPRPANILAPTYIATQYAAMIEGQSDVLIDYFVEATDNAGNVYRSDIQHVWVGAGTIGGGGGDEIVLEPDPPLRGENLMVTYDATGRALDTASQVYIHLGYDNWQSLLIPDPAMTDNGDGTWSHTLLVDECPAQLDFAFNDGNGTWDNNGGADWHVQLEGPVSPDCEEPVQVVTIDPSPAVQGENVTVTYRAAGRILQDQPDVRIHYGVNDWTPALTEPQSAAVMSKKSDNVWTYGFTVPDFAMQIDMVFNNGAPPTVWDNNGSLDWHFDTIESSGTKAKDYWSLF